MSVTPTSSTTTTGTGSSEQITNPNAILGKDDFLKLLVAQMQNQDPMNPMNEQDQMGEMAQFSTLEQITNLVTVNQSQGFSAEVSQSVSLIGKTISWLNADGSAGSGVADRVTIDQGSISIDVGGQSVDPSSIVSVQ